MIKPNPKEIIPEVVEKIKENYKPQKIILFGSYAYGKPTKDSDIDLFIIKNTRENRIDRFVNVKRIIYNPDFKIPISPLVYTPKELKKRLKEGDDFVREIISKGDVLYEKGTG